MAIIESSIGGHELRLTGTTTQLAWRVGGRAARAEARDAEILCFGDSLVMHGVLPRVLEADLGHPAYNLALPGAQAPASYFLLRRALEAGATPRALVVDFHSEVLTASVRPSRELWPELVDPRELVELGWHAGDGHFLASTAAALIWPSARHRRAIRREISAALRGDGAGPAPGLDAFLRNGRVNRGAIVSTPAPRPPDDFEGPGGSASPATRWRPHPTNVGYVRRFLDLAASRRLPVFWLIPPTSPAWQADSERRGQDAGFSGFARSMLDDYPDLVVVDGRRAGFARPAFADPTHLNARGAAALSGALATVIGPPLAGADPGPRWVDLPAYRDRPDLSPVIEDFARSQMALDRVPGETRRR